MTPKEKEQKLREQIDRVEEKIDKLLELLGSKDGKAKTSKRK